MGKINTSGKSVAPKHEVPSPLYLNNQITWCSLHSDPRFIPISLFLLSGFVKNQCLGAFLPLTSPLSLPKLSRFSQSSGTIIKCWNVWAFSNFRKIRCSYRCWILASIHVQPNISCLLVVRGTTLIGHYSTDNSSKTLSCVCPILKAQQ